MSTQNSSNMQIADFLDDTEDEDTEAVREYDWGDLTPAIEPASTPRVRLHDITGQSSQPECRGCGSVVTPQYARTMGDQDNAVHECPNCPTSTVGRRCDGAAAGLAVTERQDNQVMRR